MSFRRLGFIIAAVVEATGVAMASSAVVAGIYGEWSDARVIALSAVAVVIVADVARRSFTPAAEMTTRGLPRWLWHGSPWHSSGLCPTW